MKVYITFLFFLIFLVGCGSDNKGLDSSLLTNKACNAPCWQNLTPGKSTKADVEIFLDQLNMQDWHKGIERLEPSGCTNIRFIENDSLFGRHGLFDLHIEDGYLTYIGSDPTMTYHLGQITDQFGNPQYIAPILAIGPEANIYQLTIFYPEIGLSFEVETSNFDQGSINREMQVKFIEYSRPGDLVSFTNSKNSCEIGPQAKNFSEDYIARYIRPWNGYGMVDVI